jgi:hypothetical protein
MNIPNDVYTARLVFLVGKIELKLWVWGAVEEAISRLNEIVNGCGKIVGGRKPAEYPIVTIPEELGDHIGDEIWNRDIDRPTSGVY